MGARVVGFCLSKKLRYPTEVEARIALLSAQRKRDRQRKSDRSSEERPMEIRVYRCDICRGGWHLTHLTEEEFAARRAMKEKP